MVDDNAEPKNDGVAGKKVEKRLFFVGKSVTLQQKFCEARPYPGNDLARCILLH